MPRPQKSRRICCYPDYWSFAPDQDIANDTVVMSLDEFETIRLIDYQSKTWRERLSRRSMTRQEKSLHRLWSKADASSFQAEIILLITRSQRRSHGKEAQL